jgi:2-oxoglutarate ferredoxin oxidoreductase subunit delta
MKGMIEIDRELCKGCGYCVEACPLEVIAMTKQFNKAGYFIAVPGQIGKCTGCANCANMCPEVAITVFASRPHNRRYRPGKAGHGRKSLTAT